MTDETAVLSKFQKFGYNRNSLITREQLSILVGRLTRENKGPRVEQWPSELIDELCQQCRLNSKGQFEINDYVKVVVRAQNELTDKVRLLSKRVMELTDQRTRLEDEIQQSTQAGRLDLAQERQRLVLSIDNQLASDNSLLAQYRSDLESVTLPFNLQPRVKTPVYAPPAPRSPLPQRRYFSDSLKDVFWLTFILVLVETFVSISRGNFVNLLMVSALLAMFFLGYFSGKVVRMVLATVFFCVMMDILWLVVKSKNFCVIQGYSQYSKALKILHVINALVTLIVGIPIKLLTIVRLFPYRNGWKDTSQMLAVKVCGDWEITFQDISNVSDY